MKIKTIGDVDMATFDGLINEYFKWYIREHVIWLSDYVFE